MENKKSRLCWLISLLAVLAASYYPLQMGIRVISDMIANGTVMKENYPKYIIPYTPIAFAVIFGAALMPLFYKLLKRFALVGGAAGSLGVFFASELLFEYKVVVSHVETVTEEVTERVAKLADWQMFMCRYIPPEEYADYEYHTVTQIRRETQVDLLTGEYNPAFKMHFYIISVLLVLTLLNCLYGFYVMAKTGDKHRKKSLIMQSAASIAFLGMCIWACFTAFYRNGDIKVSPLSAVLMCVFFMLFGITAGIFVASFTLDKKKPLSIVLPSVTAAVTTIMMYIGELILLNGNLYRFGEGFLFYGIPVIVFSPADLIVVILSGAVTAAIAKAVQTKRAQKEDQ